jgi:hypothetical protein
MLHLKLKGTHKEKLFQEWGREDKGEQWRGEFKYDIIDKL